MAKILIVDDEPRIRDLIREHLQYAGFVCEEAGDGDAALAVLAQGGIDLVILDIMMPFMDGMTCLREMRTRKIMTPVIMLTARSEEYDKLAGLEGGADDYVVKPFSPREVIARIKAVLRRIGDQNTPASPVLRFDSLEINLNHYEVKVDGKVVPCTPKEVEILHLLASHPGQVFDREQILSQVWGYDYFGDTRAVDTQIKRIRQKLPQEGVSWAIRTIYGVGYKFEVAQ